MLLDDLLSQTRMVSVRYGDAELNIEYYRQRLTDAEGQRLTKAISQISEINDQSLSMICEFLARVIAWWDLYETEGMPLAINTDALRRLPLSVLNDLIVVIMHNESNPEPPTITVNCQ